MVKLVRGLDASRSCDQHKLDLIWFFTIRKTYLSSSRRSHAPILDILVPELELKASAWAQAGGRTCLSHVLYDSLRTPQEHSAVNRCLWTVIVL